MAFRMVLTCGGEAEDMFQGFQDAVSLPQKLCKVLGNQHNLTHLASKMTKFIEELHEVIFISSLIGASICGVGQLRESVGEVIWQC